MAEEGEWQKLSYEEKVQHQVANALDFSIHLFTFRRNLPCISDFSVKKISPPT